MFGIWITWSKQCPTSIALYGLSCDIIVDKHFEVRNMVEPPTPAETCPDNAYLSFFSPNLVSMSWKVITKGATAAIVRPRYTGMPMDELHFNCMLHVCDKGQVRSSLAIRHLWGIPLFWTSRTCSISSGSKIILIKHWYNNFNNPWSHFALSNHRIHHTNPPKKQLHLTSRIENHSHNPLHDGCLVDL